MMPRHRLVIGPCRRRPVLAESKSFRQASSICEQALWCRVYSLMVVLVICGGLALGGCVETADCDEHVGCESGEVCYQSECRPTCEEHAQCGDDEACLPCFEDGDGDGSGRCLGVETSACVPEE